MYVTILSEMSVSCFFQSGLPPPDRIIFAPDFEVDFEVDFEEAGRDMRDSDKVLERQGFLKPRASHTPGYTGEPYTCSKGKAGGKTLEEEETDDPDDTDDADEKGGLGGGA